MQTHVSQQSYAAQTYSYSPHSLYSPSAVFPYGSSVHAAPSSFSVPPFQQEQPQMFLSASAHTALPSNSSTADSNGSVVSDFDLSRSGLKKRRKPAPTIATGRRNLKDESVNTEEADRRDKRRERNRKSAQRCRERKIEKKEALEQQISEASATCSKYVELAESVLKAWKQRLRVLNEQLPCHSYKSQLSVADFEGLIEMMHSRQREQQAESAVSAGDTQRETESVASYSAPPLPQHGGFSECPKMETFYPSFNSDLSAALHHGYDQYCLQEGNMSYM